MRYTVRGWFDGRRVQLDWEDGRLRGPATIVAAVLGHPAGGRWISREARPLDVTDPHDSLVMINRTLDDIDAVVVSEDDPPQTDLPPRA